MPKGFYKARMFYAPKYDQQNAAQSGTDLRSTIHWEPNIMTDKDGHATFDSILMLMAGALTVL